MLMRFNIKQSLTYFLIIDNIWHFKLISFYERRYPYLKKNSDYCAKHDANNVWRAVSGDKKKQKKEAEESEKKCMAWRHGKWKNHIPAQVT